MRRGAAAGFVIASLAAGGPAHAVDAGLEGSVRAGFAKCRVLEDERERVRCYDKLATLLSPPRYQGRLTAQTDPFEITAPTLLRFESDGPIFVMYLKDAQGGIVQNLHIGGGGMATFLIEKPGTYSLQISGSETWRVWLDPAEP
ncbi:hypothetical protein SAMN02799625_05905 [Methylobacterium sp. UNC300MFChir4.1]|uniref:hypothetical protein n=1 Tax=Methylobacterium sp. UNC300MFChir4.1 TaxID=1502747 RepID=UPI0008AAE5F9|nr:hypothetical protein [Methylobacterium sp. UNC300MFChir4.1]SEP39462.1 hypothetical protein SAMN02799625_05905 [Methylobacterium sp. UNC300MFChir4.1]